jgi:hypothetical protein
MDNFTYQEDDENPGNFWVSGSAFKETCTDGEWTAEPIYWIEVDGEVDYIDNHGLRHICEVYFPNTHPDPESGMFFCDTHTKEDAKELADLLNNPSLVERLFIALINTGYITKEEN